MADDRPDDAPPGGKNEKRRHPPVIELEATELGEDGSKASKPKPDPEVSTKAEQPEPKRPVDTGTKSRSFALPLITAGIGAAAGAAVLYFALPYFMKPQAPATPDAALTREVAALSARIEAMSKQQPAANPEASALGERIDKLTNAIAETEKKLTEKRPDGSPPPEQADPALEATSKELRDALAELKKLSGQPEQPALAAAIEALSSRIATLDERMASLVAAGKAATSSEIAKQIFAVNALSAKLNSGKPFAQELATARTVLGPKATGVEGLDQSAAKGIPTVSALADQFNALIPKLLYQPKADAGFLSRLLFNATHLVQIRKIGEPQGDDVESVIARIETLLARGELTPVLWETVKLPDYARSEAAGWIAEIGKRRDAEMAVKKLLDAALATEPSKS